MIFGRASMSFRSFSILGPNATPDFEAILEGLNAQAFDGFAGEEGRARGWISLDHLFDVEFSREKNVRGPYVLFGLRLDQRRVSPAVYKAHCLMEMRATQTALGVAKVPLDERREIRRRVREQLLAETTPTSRSIGIVWHVRHRVVHVLNTGRTVLNEVEDLFDRSFELSLEPRGPTVLGLELARAAGLGQAFSDALPTALFAESLHAKAG